MACGLWPRRKPDCSTKRRMADVSQRTDEQWCFSVTLTVPRDLISASKSCIGRIKSMLLCYWYDKILAELIRKSTKWQWMVEQFGNEWCHELMLGFKTYIGSKSVAEFLSRGCWRALIMQRTSWQSEVPSKAEGKSWWGCTAVVACTCYNGSWV